QPRFANARSIRNAIDRLRLRQARRLVTGGGLIARGDLMEISADDVHASRVFRDAGQADRPPGHANRPPDQANRPPDPADPPPDQGGPAPRPLGSRRCPPAPSGDRRGPPAPPGHKLSGPSGPASGGLSGTVSRTVAPRPGAEASSSFPPSSS